MVGRGVKGCAAQVLLSLFSSAFSRGPRGAKRNAV